MTNSAFAVKGMNCAHCQASVTKALKGVDGVAEAQVSLEKNQAHVTYDPAKASPDQLAQAVEQAGFTLIVA